MLARGLLFKLLLLVWSTSAQAAPLVFEFVQGGCQPCRRMAPAIAELQAAGYDIRVTDIALYPDLVRRFDPQVTPTLVAVDDPTTQRELGRLENEQTKAQLVKFLNDAGIERVPPVKKP